MPRRARARGSRPFHLPLSDLAHATCVRTHPRIDAALFPAYVTPIFQVIASSLMFSFIRGYSHNYEVLFILSVALVMTLVLYGLFPATGPESHLGRETVFADIILRLRGGTITNLPYTGLVSCRSYHAIIAMTFTYGHRDIRQTLIPVAIVNSLMLLGLTSYGGHYFVDEIGGAVIGLLCIAVARFVYPAHSPNPAQRLPIRGSRSRVEGARGHSLRR